MVQVEGNAVVKVDGQEAGQQLQTLEDKARSLRKAIIDINKQPIIDDAKVKQLKEELKLTNQEITSLKKTTFDYQRILNNLSGASLNELNKLYSKLNFEVKLAGRNTEEYVQKSKQLALVKAEIGKVRAEMSGLNTNQSSFFGKMADGFNKYMGLLAGLGAAFVGVTLGVRKFIDSFNAFEERVDNLQALTGLTGDKLKYLSDKALEFSQNTSEEGIRITQSATDIVDAFTMVGSKRSELLAVKEDLAAVTKDAIILSEAAKGELQPAVETLTISLNMFNAPASESRRFINSIAAGSKVGAAEIPYIGQALEKAGTSAHLMNVSFEDTIGVIEAVAPFFAKAETAGNSLDKVLMKMKEKQIGYKDGVFDLNRAIDELKVKFAQGQSSADIFGAEHAKMGELLVLNQGKFNEYRKAVTGTNTAIEQAVINTDNNNSKLEQAKNKTEASAIALGEKLAPALTISTNGLNYLLKALTIIVNNFDLLKKIVIVTGSTVLAYTLVAKGATIVTWLQTAAQKALTAATKAFTAASKASPWAIIIAGIVAAVAAVIAFSDELRGATKAQKIMDDVASETKKRLNDETMGLTILMKKIEDTNTSQEDRIQLVKKLNESYGQYLPNLLDENASLDDIKKAYASINDQIKRKIELQVKEEKAKELYKEISDKQNKLKQAAGSTPTSIIGGVIDVATGNMQRRVTGSSRLNDEIANLQKTYDELLSNISQNTAPADINTGNTPPPDDNSGSGSGAGKKKQAESLKDYIADLNSQMLEDARQKARMEVEAWRLKELEKIGKSTAAASEKAQAVEAIEALHGKKLKDIDANYFKELEGKYKQTEEFIKKQNETLLTDRQAIIDSEVAAIAEKYDKEIKIATDNAAKESTLKAQFLQQASDLERLKILETNAYKANMEKNFQAEIQRIKDEYNIESSISYYDTELAKLNDYYSRGLLSAQDFENAKAVIADRSRAEDLRKEQDHYDKKFKKYREGIAKQQAITDALANFFQATKDKELAAAGDNEEKKKEIMKKYADREFAVKVSQIIASTALAVMQAFAQLGPIAGAVAAGIITATGIVQLTAANKERKRVKGLAQGDYFGVTREQDNRQFTATYGGSGVGHYSKPTVLVAEEGPEFVVSNKALQVPAFRRAINAIDSYQKGFRFLNYDGIFANMQKVRGFADGGTITTSPTTPATNNESMGLAQLIMEFRAWKQEISNWQSSLEVYVPLISIRNAETKMSNIEAKVKL